jgi:hypothetical protein
MRSSTNEKHQLISTCTGNNTQVEYDIDGSWHVPTTTGNRGSKSVTVSTGSSRQSGGASNQELSTSAIVRAASTNDDGLRASPVSLPTTSPGGNDEANSPAAWTARSGESSSGEGTVGVCIGTKRELCTAICVKLN